MPLDSHEPMLPGLLGLRFAAVEAADWSTVATTDFVSAGEVVPPELARSSPVGSVEPAGNVFAVLGSSWTIRLFTVVSTLSG